MSKLTFKGDIVHGEKYEKDGETKWKNTKVGALFYDEEKNAYKVKQFDTWFNVYPPKATDKDYRNLKNDIEKEVPKTRAQQKEEFEDEIPF
jgi:hypothetical protein